MDYFSICITYRSEIFFDFKIDFFSYMILACDRV